MHTVPHYNNIWVVTNLGEDDMNAIATQWLANCFWSSTLEPLL